MDIINVKYIRKKSSYIVKQTGHLYVPLVYCLVFISHIGRLLLSNHNSQLLVSFKTLEDMPQECVKGVHAQETVLQKKLEEHDIILAGIADAQMNILFLKTYLGAVWQCLQIRTKEQQLTKSVCEQYDALLDLVVEKKNEAINEIRKNFSIKEEGLTASTSRSIGQKRRIEEYSQLLKTLDTGSTKTSFIDKADFVVQSTKVINTIQRTCQLDTQGNGRVNTKLSSMNEEEFSSDVLGLGKVVAKLRRTSYCILEFFVLLFNYVWLQVALPVWNSQESQLNAQDSQASTKSKRPRR